MMMSAMPTEFYVLVGVCIAIMGFSAFYLGSEDWRARAAARVGLVTAGAVLFVGTMTYLSIFAAVVIVVIPLVLILAWVTDFFSGLF